MIFLNKFYLLEVKFAILREIVKNFKSILCMIIIYYYFNKSLIIKLDQEKKISKVKNIFSFFIFLLKN